MTPIPTFFLSIFPFSFSIHYNTKQQLLSVAVAFFFFKRKKRHKVYAYTKTQQIILSTFSHSVQISIHTCASLKSHNGKLVPCVCVVVCLCVCEQLALGAGIKAFVGEVLFVQAVHTGTVNACACVCVYNV